jgi:hypothetical protein
VAAILADRSPKYYDDFIQGVTISNGGNPSPGDGGKEGRVDAVQAVIADRQKRWKEMCEQDPLVCRFNDLLAEVRSAQGENVSVDDYLAGANRGNDLASLVQGRTRKDQLLAKAGLDRKDGGFILTDLAPSEAGEEPDNREVGVLGRQPPLTGLFNPLLQSNLQHQWAFAHAMGGPQGPWNPYGQQPMGEDPYGNQSQDEKEPEKDQDEETPRMTKAHREVFKSLREAIMRVGNAYADEDMDEVKKSRKAFEDLVAKHDSASVPSLQEVAPLAGYELLRTWTDIAAKIVGKIRKEFVAYQEARFLKKEPSS